MRVPVHYRWAIGHPSAIREWDITYVVTPGHPAFFSTEEEARAHYPKEHAYLAEGRGYVTKLMRFDYSAGKKSVTPLPDGPEKGAGSREMREWEALRAEQDGERMQSDVEG